MYDFANQLGSPSNLQEPRGLSERWEVESMIPLGRQSFIFEMVLSGFLTVPFCMSLDLPVGGTRKCADRAHIY